RPSLCANRPERAPAGACRSYVVLSGGTTSAPLLEELVSHAVDGYFNRDESDYSGWFRILSAELAEKSATPFHTYVKMAKDSWHTRPATPAATRCATRPGLATSTTLLGEHMLRADLSVSVPMLDSLMHPKGVIAAAQSLAAKAFGARKTYFAHGTEPPPPTRPSAGPRATKLLLDRNCHKSVHYDVKSCPTDRPVYMDCSARPQFGIFGPPIVEAAHSSAGIKVIIDEAWYAFARFHPAFRPTALEAGADYVTQSSQHGSHVNDPAFDEHLFRENFNMYASTSPQYGLIASLDVGRKQAVMEGYGLLDRTVKLSGELRQRDQLHGGFRAAGAGDLLPEELQQDGIRLDPTKLTVDISKSGYSAQELQQILFERFNIQGEKRTFNTITLLLSMAPPAASRLACLPRLAFYESGERLLLLDDDGRQTRHCLTASSTWAIVTYLARLTKGPKALEIHGLADCDGEYGVRVLTDQEFKEHPVRGLFE
uniref:Protein kinase domain-containing protein n=1 Tax=Macrostomum lignano TaxID=282301 RepID=A0A1I8FFN8_9PLAT